MKKHTSTVINLSPNIRFISQQVNMPLLRLLHQISNMYQNVKVAQNEFHEQPDLSKESTAKNEFRLVSDHNENSSDERYEQFNEMIGLPNSMANSKTRVPGLGPLIQLTPSPNAKNRPQSFAQKLRSTGKSVKGKLGCTYLNESSSFPLRDSPTTSVSEQPMFKLSLESKASFNGLSVNTDYHGLGKPGLNDSLPPMDTSNC